MKNRIAFILLVLVFSCKKNDLPQGLELTYEKTEIHFDTIFSGMQSPARRIKIFNNNNADIRITDLRLAGGANSPYHLNLNGKQGKEFSGVNVAAGDSLYLFINFISNLNGVSKDSVWINYNGRQDKLLLEANALDAIRLNHHTITGQHVFNAVKPYYLTDTLFIEQGAVLTIDEGSRIYAASNSPIIVHGTLNVNGTAPAPVTFAGNRFDEPYASSAGAWPGIIFSSTSRNSNIFFAHINQAITAIDIKPSDHAQLTLQQSRIQLASDAGIKGTGGIANINNCLIVNCNNNVLFTGGNYSLINNTIASYSTYYFNRKTPVATFQNFTEEGNYSANLTIVGLNNIFWGEGFKDEIITRNNGAQSMSIKMYHSIYKAESEPQFINFTNCYPNADPMFFLADGRRNEFDFNLTAGSPAIDSGAPTTFANDAAGNSRKIGETDIGAYEKQ